MENEIHRIIDTLEYRGFTVDFYFDDSGQQAFTIWENKEVCFGSFNNNYQDDMKFLIDQKLDRIKDFSDFPGAQLEWFFNGYYGCRDIKLSYKTRILKIFLVEDEAAVNTDLVVKEAEEILNKLRLAGVIKP